MNESTEMEDLPSQPRNVEINEHVVSPDPASVWAWTTAALLVLLASCLIVFPRFLLFLSEISNSHEQRSALTSLESFLATHSGIWLVAVALTLVLTGPIPAGQETQKAVHPSLVPLTIASNVSALVSYNTYNVGALGTIICIGSAIIGLWGLWTILFGYSSWISKTTGADKHTSSFLFRNKYAASIQKKKWKDERK